MSIYHFSAKRNNGELQSLGDYRGKVLLIVNTASQCGFTPQYEGLEKLYQAYRDQGFEVLAFPCNQFRGQEPGSDAEIAQFCQVNYGASFPIFAKIKVNGHDAHPLYKYMKSKKGLWPFQFIKWNFTKFLIDRQGCVVKRFSPTTKPEEISANIEKLL